MSDAPRPRLCHMRKWPDFGGYGFNLHAETGRAGHYVGTVDPRSPAEAGGLRQYDRIVEVNGVSVGNENHGQVVERIKSVDSEVKLLVVDREGDIYYKDMKVMITGSMYNILNRETPITNPYSGRQDDAVESSDTGNPSDSHNTATCSTGDQDNILELSGSAKEAREKLMKKRCDKSADMTFKDKYNLLKKL